MIESRPFILRSPTFAALWRTDDNPSLPPSPSVETVRHTRRAKAYTVLPSLPLSTTAYPKPIIELKPTTGFDSLWYWVKERHAIYIARREGKLGPWTNDPILSQYKFTNVFREIDAESQACIRIANSGPSLDSFEEQFLRCILFKTFNLDSTWQLLTRGLGRSLG